MPSSGLKIDVIILDHNLETPEGFTKLAEICDSASPDSAIILTSGQFAKGEAAPELLARDVEAIYLDKHQLLRSEKEFDDAIDMALEKRRRER